MIICLDTETTGLNPGVNEILTLSIVNAETGESVYEGMYRPLRETEWPYAEKINHISPEMVKDCPNITEEDEEIRALLESAETVVAYNVAFDLPFIEAAVGSLPEDMIVSDPMRDYARMLGGTQWIKLIEAAKAVKHVWSGRAHGSLADAEAAAAVWRWLRDKGEATTCAWSEFKLS